jgi:uncharacterized protein YbaA (DUF1428 family)
MAAYVDGFVIPVPKKNVATYRKIAKAACKVWMDHGALQYIEAVGDDLGANYGTPFTKLARTKPNETVIFSYIVYKSRAHRDRVNAKVMKDKRMLKMMQAPMPFEGKRMSMGGFKIIVKA